MNLKLITTLLAAALLAASLSVRAERVAFVNANLHPVSSAAMAEGVMLVADGRIEALGPNVEIPEDVRRVDLEGRHVYPGLVHAGTVLGLTEIGSVAGTDDTTETGQINAAIRAEIAINHDSMLSPRT